MHLTSLPLMSSKWTSTLGVWENAIPSKRNKIAVCFGISILWEWSYLLRGKSSGQLCRPRQSETRVLANVAETSPLRSSTQLKAQIQPAVGVNPDPKYQAFRAENVGSGPAFDLKFVAAPTDSDAFSIGVQILLANTYHLCKIFLP